tara:strand:+ start:1160 stop:1297 length:138 start_codon:yes stop_codon:yes gene_type:complete
MVPHLYLRASVKFDIINVKFITKLRTGGKMEIVNEMLKLEIKRCE